MLPVVAVTRFGPWLGRTVQKQPGLLASLVSKLRTAGATVGDTTKDVIGYFKASPINASLVLATFASLGVAVSELFEGTDVTSDDNLLSFVEGLESTRRAALEKAGKEAFKLVKDAGNASASLDLQISEKEADLITAREVLGWAKGHYGSVTGAMRAHRLAQAFFEMNYDDVVSGYTNLKV